MAMKMMVALNTYENSGFNAYENDDDSEHL